ncbi:hypothetical protein E0H80_13995 [Acinetobacter sp. ANC 4779]|uniref:hypothetical protein n=1 Tax=Acinetobacter sp. ANC 4779 TaxID=2529848 RepID=UPI00103F1F89|nr:hypothetical protein [Acinetobacter sp. ANC 4779]TCB48786.1 hypothetical protein E0H80_13995 [Acinetobacter sp. ANC 4779]
MSLKKIVLCLSSLLLIHTAQAKATELDQYLVKKQIIDQTYKIKDTKALNEILNVISDEDSRTMPYQVDQNTLIEQLRFYADHIDLQGIITTPDFGQFAEDIGDKKVKYLIKQNLIQNCHLLFEHEFQRINPYHVAIKLSSNDKNYHLNIKNTECQF